MLSLKMKQKVYLPDQIVASRGEIGHEMFYIHHGELEVVFIHKVLSLGKDLVIIVIFFLEFWVTVGG